MPLPLRLWVGARLADLWLHHPPVVSVLRDKVEQGVRKRVMRTETNGIG